MAGAFLHEVDIVSLFDFLSSKDVPVMEIECIRFITGGSPFPRGDTGMFNAHFSLYHAFYRLKYFAGELGYYLHMDPMRIRLIKVPRDRSCQFYDDRLGRFCAEDSGGAVYCPVHGMLVHGDIRNPVYDAVEDFYSNGANIMFGGSGLLRKLMDGCIVYAFHRDEIDNALRFFGLECPGRKRIRNRYYALAKEYHPDLHGGDDTMMKELNRSYQVLKEVYVM